MLCLEMNWLRKAQECFKTAQALNPRETRYRKRVRSFSEEATGPDQLNGLIREELRLVQVRRSQADRNRNNVKGKKWLKKERKKQGNRPCLLAN